jgi:hypothetical protein
MFDGELMCPHWGHETVPVWVAAAAAATGAPAGAAATGWAVGRGAAEVAGEMATVPPNPAAPGAGAVPAACAVRMP